MDIGPTELLIILFIVILIFGPGRLVHLGGELGQGIREFRQGLKGEENISAEVTLENEEERTDKDSDQ